MKHSLAQVSDMAQDCLSVTGKLALKPFEPDIIAIALGISVEEANRNLGELVDYGLLIRPQAFYQVSHALVHTYARTEMPSDGEALSRLAEHHDKFIRKQSDLGLDGYALLDSQLDHILAVQSACNNASQWDAVCGLAWALNNYLDLQGHWAERRKSAEAGLYAARAGERRYDEAAFLALPGLAHAALGDAKRAIEYYERALAIAREIGDRRGEGNALFNMSLAMDKLSERSQAIDLARSAEKIFNQIESLNANEVRRQFENWQGNMRK